MATGPGGNPYAGNRHADVLSEEPTEEGPKLRLLEEVKNRAKGAFTQKDMQSAELLYSKAITLLDTMPDKREHTLYSNRAMVRLNLNKVDDALADANACLDLEPTFAKAWHRKAQALLRLSEYDDAIKAAQEGAKVEPNNKAFAEIIEKAEKDKAKDQEDKARLKRDAQDVKVELHNASTSRQANKPKPAAEGEDLSMKGYKTRADGKKTSYFHTDISDEAKALIEAQGFGKPKKLEEGDMGAPVDVKGGGSQWNQAGTYEEKGMLKWVEENLKAGMKGLVYEVPSMAGSKLTATDVEDIKGDASISSSRGKRRRLLDITFAVSFEGKVGDASGKAKLVFSEVTTGDDEPEVKLEGHKDTPPGVVEMLRRPANEGLQPLILEQLKKLVEEYKAK